MHNTHILVIDDESDRAEATAHIIKTNVKNPDVDDRSWSSIASVDEFVRQYRLNIINNYRGLLVTTNIVGIQNGFVSMLQHYTNRVNVMITTCWEEEEAEVELMKNGADPGRIQCVHCPADCGSDDYVSHRERIESALFDIQESNGHLMLR